MSPRDRFAVLLPPSEGKAEGGDGRWDPSLGRFGSLARRRRDVARALAAAMAAEEADLTKLLGVKGDTLERAVRANRRLVRQPVALPASDRFTGVVHDHLDLPSLPAAARRRAERSVIYFSALCGALAPGDPVPDHRAKMSIRVEPLGNLATWWRSHLDLALAPILRGATVVDLLPNEHAAAMTPRPAEWSGWYRARFERVDVDGTRKVVGHEAKAGKGLFARHLLRAGRVDDDTIGAFRTDDGWEVESIEPGGDADATTAVIVRRVA